MFSSVLLINILQRSLMSIFCFIRDRRRADGYRYPVLEINIYNCVLLASTPEGVIGQANVQHEENGNWYAILH